LKPGSRAASAYGKLEVSERHRHRYELNNEYLDLLQKAGLEVTGVSPDGLLAEVVEYADHPWYVGVQFHPELKSRPLSPHPLFASFVAASFASAGYTYTAEERLGIKIPD